MIEQMIRWQILGYLPPCALYLKVCKSIIYFSLFVLTSDSFLVCNPNFIFHWNGAERLVLAFVLLTMKSNNFFNWSYFYSLAILVITSIIFGTNILVQWAILVLALSSLSSSFTLNPLMTN